jgi:hypothetical protein
MPSASLSLSLSLCVCVCLSLSLSQSLSLSIAFRWPVAMPVARSLAGIRLSHVSRSVPELFADGGGDAEWRLHSTAVDHQPRWVGGVERLPVWAAALCKCGERAHDALRDRELRGREGHVQVCGARVAVDERDLGHVARAADTLLEAELGEDRRAERVDVVVLVHVRRRMHRARGGLRGAREEVVGQDLDHGGERVVRVQSRVVLPRRSGRVRAEQDRERRLDLEATSRRG